MRGAGAGTMGFNMSLRGNNYTGHNRANYHYNIHIEYMPT
jgi:hypothetical protein